MTDSSTLGTTSPTVNTTSNSEQVAPNSPPEQPSNDCCRVQLTEADMASLSSADWTFRWRLQDTYISSLEQRLHRQEGEMSELRDREQRQRGQLCESQQREKALLRRLAAKEQEMHDLVHQLAELKATPILPTSLRSSYLDPAVNTLYTLLRGELRATKARLDDTQHELAAWKFTPDSNTGKRLMAKCRLLHQENEELGRMTSSGRIAMLEGELALQKGFSEEVRVSQTELEAFLADLEEDVEGMQSTIMFLQGELRRCNEQLQAAERQTTAHVQSQQQEEETATPTVNHKQEQQQQNGHLPVPSTIVRANGENFSEGLLPTVNGDGVVEEQWAASAEAIDVAVVEQGRTKRVRRSSVLSIDYECEDVAMMMMMNDDGHHHHHDGGGGVEEEDGMLVITSNGDVAMSDAE